MILYLRTKGDKPYHYNVGRGKNPVESIERLPHGYKITSSDRVTVIADEEVALVEYEREDDEPQPAHNTTKQYPSG